LFRDAEVDVGLELFDLGVPASADYSWLGVLVEPGLVGIACFGPTPATDGTYDLYWIAVDARVQGLGAGRALLAAVERELGVRGARLLVAETSGRDDYMTTRRFYERCGYETKAVIADFYAPGDSRVVMVKRLAPRAQLAMPGSAL
jgi:ribosomal protein S18 acetylase RimI-like enzyme